MHLLNLVCRKGLVCINIRAATADRVDLRSKCAVITAERVGAVCLDIYFPLGIFTVFVVTTNSFICTGSVHRWVC